MYTSHYPIWMILLQIALSYFPGKLVYARDILNKSIPPTSFKVGVQSFYLKNDQQLPLWFQCETDQSAMIFLGLANGKAKSVLAFPRNKPDWQAPGEFVSQDEPDCAMGKCWWKFKETDGDHRNISVQESHYFDAESGFWTPQYIITTNSARPGLKEMTEMCRWYPRLRVSAFTEQASIYITEDRSGRFTLRIFDLAKPFGFVANKTAGEKHTFDAEREIETFMFNKGTVTHFIVVKAKPDEHPALELQSKRDGKIIRQQTAISFTYTKAIPKP
jgi:hypothetical protein